MTVVILLIMPKNTSYVVKPMCVYLRSKTCMQETNTTKHIARAQSNYDCNLRSTAMPREGESEGYVIKACSPHNNICHLNPAVVSESSKCHCSPLNDNCKCELPSHVHWIVKWFKFGRYCGGKATKQQSTCSGTVGKIKNSCKRKPSFHAQWITASCGQHPPSWDDTKNVNHFGSTKNQAQLSFTQKLKIHWE